MSNYEFRRVASQNLPDGMECRVFPSSSSYRNPYIPGIENDDYF